MAKINILGLICLALGAIVVGFQAIGNLVQESYEWKSLTLFDVLAAEQVGWVDAIPVDFLQNAIIYVMDAPLYLIFFVIAGVCFLISFLFRL